jgi:hypothetical protein
VHLGSVLLQRENVRRYSERTQQRCDIERHRGVLQILNPVVGCNQGRITHTSKTKKQKKSFFGNEFLFSDYYFKTYFKKERNEREIEKEKEKECNK